MNSIAILEAVNTSYVPFNGQQILTAVAAGVTYVAMRQIVENIGIDWTGQSVKLRKMRTNSTVEISLWLPLMASYVSFYAYR